MRTVQAHTMDLTKGSVFKQLLLFALPLVLSNMLQQFYSAADVIVVGKFAGNTALAAVGSTGALTTLLLGLFNGLAIGANIICANLFGARKPMALSRTMHTALLLAALSGVGMAVLGVIFARPMLQLMNSPENVIDQATLYMRIYFCGVPASMIYNFGSGILRAHGDTRRPMVILTATGVVNVVLNLVLVICFHWDVAGVAVATIAAQFLSAIAIVYILFNPKDEYRMQLKALRLHKSELVSIIRLGIPCGMNGVVFSISNVLLQSAVNAQGDIVVAGVGAANNISAFVMVFVGSFYTACVSFSGQNFGAKLYRRIDKLLLCSCLSAASLIAASALGCTLFSDTVLSLYTNDASVIAAGIPILRIMVWGYVIYCIPESAIGCLRGMGKGSGPTMLNVFFICVPRLIWLYTVFPLYPTTPVLYLCYPISYMICAVVQVLYYIRSRKALDHQ